MPTYHCRVPGCGRFVSTNGDACARHTSHPGDITLDPEIEAIRKVLKDVHTIQDVEARAKLIPRIVSVSVQTIKTGHQLGSRDSSELMRLLEVVAQELEKKG